MIKSAEDITLRDILLDAAAKEFSVELSDIKPVVVSFHFQKQMKAMVANPQRWAKRHVRPLWKNVCRLRR